MKKVGIMGGTFNPIHFAHLILAENALEQCNLDEIMFLPSGFPAYKSQEELVSVQDRLAMLQAAIHENPHFYVSTQELERKGPTYTIDTLRELHEHDKYTLETEKKEYYFILGGDSLFQFEKWRQAEEIVKLCRLVAAVREKNGYFALKEKAAKLQKQYGAEITIIDTPYLELSSSMLRKRVANGRSIRYFLPEQVISYIQEHKLYQKKKNET